MSRENYYILLGLDPAEEDPAKIEAAIVAKQREWAMLRTHPTKGTWASSYIQQIPAMRRALSNPGDRQAEAEDARRQLLNRQKEKYTDLDEALNLLGAKGHILESELESLLKRGNFKTFELSDLQERISRLSIEIIKDEPKSELEKISPIDTSTEKKIESGLQLLGKKDLYDFLGLHKNSSLEALQSRTSEEYARTRLQTKKDAQVTANQELIGYCQHLFKDVTSRKRYDKTLDQQRFKSLDKHIAVAGMDKEIISSEFKFIVEEGAKLGIGKDDIIAYIKKVAAANNWSVVLPDTGSSLDQMAVCGVCGALNSPKVNACTNCGYKLQEHCPKCNTLNPSSARNCAKCGYATGDMPNALPLLRSAKDALTEGNFAEAEKLYTLANHYWENHPDIITGRQKIKSQSDQLQLALKKVQASIGEGAYYQAGIVLKEIQTLPGGATATVELEKTISQKLADTEQWLVKARAAVTPADKEEAYLLALQHSKDCKEASEGLARIPPEPPGILTITLQHENVLLQWKPPLSKAVLTYKVVRKTGALPAHDNDGDNLVVTAQHSFLDRTGEPGLTYYYAVFSLRNSVPSVKGAISSPVTKVADVINLQVIPADKTVKLIWQAPPNILRVEVWTKKGAPPASRIDGRLLSAVRNDGASHDGLVNDELQGYLVVAVFKDAFGKECYAPGVKAHAAASAPPRPVDYLLVHQQGGRVELEWRDIDDQVEIYYAEKRFHFHIGELLPYSQLSNIGTSIPVLQKGKAAFQLERHGISYLLPITVKGQLAVAGQVAEIKHWVEISNLEFQVDGARLILTWTFPAGVDRVEVTYGDPYDIGNATCRIVTKNEYMRTGNFTILSLPEQTPIMKVHVRTILEDDKGILAYSNGVQLIAKIKKTIIRFFIKKNSLTSLFSNIYKFDLVVEVDGPFEARLQLVVKENNRLISFKDPDRVIVRDFSASDFISLNTLKVSFSYKPGNKGVKTLFFSMIPMNPDDKDCYQIEENGKKITL